MRYGIPLAISCLFIGEMSLQAQERVPLPAPDPVQPGIQPGATGQPPVGQPGGQIPQVPPSGQYPAPGPYPQPGPYQPYPPYPPPGWPPPAGWGGPPPGAYNPYPLPGLSLHDPANNPSFWLGAEALVWWSKNQPLPVPLITTGPASSGTNPGGIGVQGTVSLNGPLNYGTEGGVRLFGGGWFDIAHTWGLEGSLFILGQNGASFSANDHSGTGAFVINEPVNGAPFSTLVSAPGVDTGNVVVNSNSQFWGLDLNLMYNLYRGPNLSVTLLGGFRYLELDEWINITANSALFQNTVYTDNFGNVLAAAPPGSTVTVVDQFGTHNEFYGGQIGARVDYNWNRWSFSATGFLAIGATHETVNVNGTTTVYPVNGTPVPLSGGNYATLQMGHYSQDCFAVAPELRLNVGYQITPHLRATIGYDFIYLSSVLRPGNQIDNTYDGVNHPLVPFKTSSYWSQGLNLGLQFNF
jgi:hypothetical protein